MGERKLLVSPASGRATGVKVGVPTPAAAGPDLLTRVWQAKYGQVSGGPPGTRLRKPAGTCLRGRGPPQRAQRVPGARLGHGGPRAHCPRLRGSGRLFRSEGQQRSRDDLRAKSSCSHGLGEAGLGVPQTDVLQRPICLSQLRKPALSESWPMWAGVLEGQPSVTARRRSRARACLPATRAAGLWGAGLRAEGLWGTGLWAAGLRVQGSGAQGSGLHGSGCRALGHRALGCRAPGRRAPGCRALGRRALGCRASGCCYSHRKRPNWPPSPLPIAGTGRAADQNHLAGHFSLHRNAGVVDPVTVLKASS